MHENVYAYIDEKGYSNVGCGCGNVVVDVVVRGRGVAVMQCVVTHWVVVAMMGRSYSCGNAGGRMAMYGVVVVIRGAIVVTRGWWW